ncbi:MAG: alpha/beta fold hydrolase [Xanthomonadales bacterium]|nr:alpha/beta fold hydrolase [Xanthomonadales bacterium]
MLERRTGRRLAGRTALFSALAIALGAGVLIAGRAHAQETAEAAETPAPAPVPAPAPAAFDPVATAQSVLDAMDAGDFAGVHARFDETMAAAVGEDRLRQLWTALPTQLGAAEGRGEPRTLERDGTRIVVVPLRYAATTIDASLAFEADGRISGFLIQPAAAAPTPATPVPADAPYTERELSIGDGDAALPATLTLPKSKEPVAAVVLVHGSGPHDRDETIGPNKPFLDLARGLAERGIAVLRYEKRTKAHPEQFADGGTIDLETTDDAVQAAALLRAQPGIDPKRVFVLGHSQGAMLAPRIGARDPEIAGLILLAAPSRPLLDLAIEQRKRAAVLDDGRTSDAEGAEIAKLTAQVEAVRRGEDVSGADAPLGVPARYWRTVEAVDPIAEARAAKQPMLLLQGGNDLQVVDADWQGWRGAFHDDPRVAFKLYDDLSHLGIPGEGLPKDYTTPGHVAPALIDDVAAWIGAVGRPAPKPRAPKRKPR